MDRIKSVKGMNDLFEEDLVTWRKLESCARDTFLRFGYQELRTPILEQTALFVRGVGEGTDIVDKEMFHFLDGAEGKKTDVCLRPEGTAGVVRSLIQHNGIPVDGERKVFYLGPMFRRERPQKGRYRQFHQIGAEAFGLSAASADVEMMAMVHLFHESLGLSGVTLKLNSLGDPEDRDRYSAALRSFLDDKKDALSADSQRRLERNPLRILDSKAPQDQEIVQNAPTPIDHLSDEARAHFDAVTAGLTDLGVPFQVTPRLVRGLDYYTRTVFEVQADTGLGAQNTVAAGGRYDNLVAQLGGNASAGVGFAGGIERLVLLLQDAGLAKPAAVADLMLIAADDAGRKVVPKLAFLLRRLGLRVDVDHRGRKVKALFKRADKERVCHVLVLGDREVDQGRGQLKQMATGNVIEASLDPASLFAAVQSATFAKSTSA